MNGILDILFMVTSVFAMFVLLVLAVAMLINITKD
jgi:hypothetical protein